jgi:ADP-ribose pyrophosphatase
VVEQIGKVDSRREYTGRVINLDIDRVRFPDGSIGELEMIRHSGASAVVPFLNEPTAEDPQLLLIRQYRYAAGGFMYEIPAGRLDTGEAPAACARRELEEETGWTADRIEHVFTFYTTPGFTDEVIHIFRARLISRGEARREADEFMELVPVSMSTALEMIHRGEIMDGKTIVALLYMAQFDERGS